jgi:hypothetical protein
MPEIKKDLQYFKEEVAKELGLKFWDEIKEHESLCNSLTGLTMLATDRFHTYELSKLKEQLAQKDKEIFDLTYSRDTYKDLYHERKETIERLTKELLDYEDFNECEGCGNENDSSNRYCKNCM